MRQLDLTERILRLRGVPVFRNLSATALAPLAASMRSNTFEKGDVILREDELPKAFHMLLTGAVTMRRHGNTIRTITAPGGVGFLGVLARTAGGTEAIAESRVETFELSADALDEMFEDHFSVLFGTMRWIAERLVTENIQAPPRPYEPPPDDYEEFEGEGEIGIVERIFLVRRTLAFRQSNVNSVARLARLMKQVHFNPGDYVWRAGDKSLASYFIVAGKGELSWHDGVSRQYVGPSYIVGGIEAIAGKPRWNDFIVTEPMTVLHGNREGLIDMFEDDLEVARGFMSMMASFLLLLWDRKAERDAGHILTPEVEFLPGVIRQDPVKKPEE